MSSWNIESVIYIGSCVAVVYEENFENLSLLSLASIFFFF